jgi:hypothetical protein
MYSASRPTQEAVEDKSNDEIAAWVNMVHDLRADDEFAHVSNWNVSAALEKGALRETML